MRDEPDVCILVAEIPGVARLVDALGALEAQHAVERCLNRVDRSIEAHGGERVRRDAERLCAAFERCDDAVLAACELIDRVRALPPTGGLRMAARAGLHYGQRGSAEAESAAQAVAGRLAAIARPGGALATKEVAMRLSAALRPFAVAAPVRASALDGLAPAAFAISRPATGAAADGRPARLRLRHGENELFVENVRPVVLLGRELGNDIVIGDARASRQHARIEQRHQGFVLIDESTNGTCLVDAGGLEQCVRGGERLLLGSGRFACGVPVQDAQADVVFFEIVPSGAA